MATRARLLRRILAALAALALAAALLELVARALIALSWVHPAPVLTADAGSVRLHPSYGFALHPGQNGGKRVNQFGLRGPDFEEAKRPGCVRVLAIGDSTTFGNRVADAATYPTVLQGLLAARHPTRCVEVINAGIESAHSYQQLLRTRDLYVRLQPDVVIFYLGWNDMVHELLMGADFDPRDVTQNPSYLVEPRAGRRALLRASAFARLTRSTLVRRRFERGLRRLAMEPDPGPRLAPAAQALGRNVASMMDALAPTGARFVIVRLPWLLRDDRLAEELAGLRRRPVAPEIQATLGSLSPRRSYAELLMRELNPLARRERVTIADCAAPFEARDLDARLPLFNDVIHPSAAGYAVIARCLADHLEPLGPPGSPPR
jgi:lysophospholipase L1-like esterase